MINPRPITYAQNREDIILEGFFDPEETGTYVDVGAYDPDFDSVTKLFYNKGWSGINIEPQPDRHKIFLKKRPRDINLNIGINVKKDKLQLRSYENQGLSTFSEEMKQSYERGTNDQTRAYKDISVSVMPLEAVFEKHNLNSIQFLKVDVEGFEYEVLVSNNWRKYRPEVLCIEANHILHDWRPLLKKHDYSFVFSDGLNEYYADNQTDRASRFNFIEAVLFREPIVHFKLLDDFEEYDKIIAWQNDTIETNSFQAARADQAELDKHILQNELLVSKTLLSEVTPLKRHIKRHIKLRLRKLDLIITNKTAAKNGYKPSTVTISSNTRTIDELLRQAQLNDRADFSRYNRPLDPGIALRLYQKSKLVTIKIIRKAIHSSKKAPY